MLPLRRTMHALLVSTIFGAGCAGDLGASRDLPTCNSQPIDIPDFTPGESVDVEAAGQIGRRFVYTRSDGARVTFLFGIPSDAGAGLPKKQMIPLKTVGVAQLHGRGLDWALTWNELPPCDPMAATGTGIGKADFIASLGLAGIIPREEEEGEGGLEGEPGGIEEEFEEEGEIEEGVLPPGGPAVQFVAVFETALDPADLKRVRRELEDVAGAGAWFGTLDCWKGLPRRLGVSRDRSGAGVVALTANELDFLVERVGRAAIFYGQLKRSPGCPT